MFFTHGASTTIRLLMKKTPLGLSLLAGLGAGHFASVTEAAEETVHLDRWFEPDAARAARYEERYALYREVYPTLKGIHHRM